MNANTILPTCGEGRHAKRGGGEYRQVRRPTTYTARRLRRQMTLPEVLLWQALKSGEHGLRFRRQHPIGAYVADFYCAAALLVVEVDGMAHDMGNRPQSDASRDACLHQKGYAVLRIPAADILKDASGVAEAIVRTALPLRQSLRDCHLPMNGEDL